MEKAQATLNGHTYTSGDLVDVILKGYKKEGIAELKGATISIGKHSATVYYNLGNLVHKDKKLCLDGFHADEVGFDAFEFKCHWKIAANSPKSGWSIIDAYADAESLKPAIPKVDIVEIF